MLYVKRIIHTSIRIYNFVQRFKDNIQEVLEKYL